MLYKGPYIAGSINRTTNSAGQINASGNANVQIGDNHNFHEDFLPGFPRARSVAPSPSSIPSLSASGSNDFKFDVAIFCALPLEADAVEALFDERWDSDNQYGKARGDPNAYSAGVIGTHNVVLVYMSGIGKSHGATAAAFCRCSFPSVRLALVLGICGGAPSTPDDQEICLGDVVISSGVVQYDFGRRYAHGLERKDTLLDTLGRPSLEIRLLLDELGRQCGRERLQNKLLEHLHVALRKLGRVSGSDMHGGMGWQCGPTIAPTVHIGLVASGDQVIKSEEFRNSLMAKEGVIAFEMEGAGIWDTFPCLVIKGVADYADRNKNREGQDYAAATSAACAKAFLELWV
ncbi:5'-methylthioadenosine/S-adenosylhomocysteine nucleosidase family protein [Aspergillus undulatus]|uniref:5'-methylthioadenosine/S-adenosylhomocysteine nucleosidase family protein n=1 Tax=Aspergillus undulatus TaxID=1810928 RepID=UPI003CCCC182